MDFLASMVVAFVIIFGITLVYSLTKVSAASDIKLLLMEDGKAIFDEDVITLETCMKAYLSHGYITELNNGKIEDIIFEA